jgi:hypothetical protein
LHHKRGVAEKMDAARLSCAGRTHFDEQLAVVFSYRDDFAGVANTSRGRACSMNRPLSLPDSTIIVNGSPFGQQISKSFAVLSEPLWCWT